MESIMYLETSKGQAKFEWRNYIRDSNTPSIITVNRDIFNLQNISRACGARETFPPMFKTISIEIYQQH